MELETRSERALVHAWRLFRGYGSQVSTALSAIAFGLSSVRAIEDWQPALMIAGVAFGVVGIAMLVVVRPTYATLFAERNSAISQAAKRSEVLQQTLTSALKKLAKELENTQTHHRLSLYCFEDGCFIMLARHSTHAKWNRPGRVVYREASDVISEAWNKGRSLVVDLPATKSKRVDRQVQKQGMSLDDANGLTMPSRSLAGFRLVEGDSHVGVLVLESTEPKGVSAATLDALGKALFVASLSTMMALSKDHLPAMVRHVSSK